MVMLGLPRPQVVVVLGTGTLLVLALSFYRGHRDSLIRYLGIRQLFRFENWFERRVMELERPGEFPLRGAMFMLMAAFLAFEVFPLRAAAAGMLVLAIADSASTVVGTLFGSHKIKFNRKKSVEGSAAFFIGSAAVLAGFMHPVSAVVLSLVVALVEALPGLDDNITVPVAISALMVLLTLA